MHAARLSCFGSMLVPTETNVGGLSAMQGGAVAQRRTGRDALPKFVTLQGCVTPGFGRRSRFKV